jgi:hypothetical protein
VAGKSTAADGGGRLGIGDLEYGSTVQGAPWKSMRAACGVRTGE